MKWLLTDFTLCFSLCFSPANSNRKGRGLADQGTSLLRAVHVWGHPDEDPLLPGRSHLAWTPAQQWGDACGWVCGIPSPLERNAVRLLHPRGNARVHCGVRAAGCPQCPVATVLGLSCCGSGSVPVCRSLVQNQGEVLPSPWGAHHPQTQILLLSAVKITLCFKYCQCIMNDPVTNRP